MATRGKRQRASRTAKAAGDPSHPETTRRAAAVPGHRDAVGPVMSRQGRRSTRCRTGSTSATGSISPPLAPLPDQVVNCDLVPTILDQGQEGACTGFALAAVVNFQLRRSPEADGGQPAHALRDGAPLRRVARREVRGLVRPRRDEGLGAARRLHEVLARQAARRPAPHARAGAARRADTPGGAYYRVMHREIRDMHAALAEVGILYVTLMVHEGWDEPGPTTARSTTSIRSRARSEAHPAGDPSDRAGRRRARRRHRRLHARRASSSRIPGAPTGAPTASRSCRTRISCCTPPTCGSPSSACRWS